MFELQSKVLSVREVFVDRDVDQRVPSPTPLALDDGFVLPTRGPARAAIRLGLAGPGTGSTWLAPASVLAKSASSVTAVIVTAPAVRRLKEPTFPISSFSLRCSNSIRTRVLPPRASSATGPDVFCAAGYPPFWERQSLGRVSGRRLGQSVPWGPRGSGRKARRNPLPRPGAPGIARSGERGSGVGALCDTDSPCAS